MRRRGTKYKAFLKRFKLADGSETRLWYEALTRCACGKRFGYVPREPLPLGVTCSCGREIRPRAAVRSIQKENG
jgi:hypothetical protein